MFGARSYILINSGRQGKHFASWLCSEKSVQNQKILKESKRMYGKPINEEAFLSGTSANYLENMYRAWQRDPSSVHVSWDSYFRHDQGGGPGYYPPPQSAHLGRNMMPMPLPQGQLQTGTAAGTSTGVADETSIDTH